MMIYLISHIAPPTSEPAALDSRPHEARPRTGCAALLDVELPVLAGQDEPQDGTRQHD